jgi:hypothetical protein
MTNSAKNCPHCRFVTHIPFVCENDLSSLIHALGQLETLLPPTNVIIRKLRYKLLRFTDSEIAGNSLTSETLSQVSKFLDSEESSPYRSYNHLMVVFCDAATLASNLGAFDRSIAWFQNCLLYCELLYGSSSKAYRCIDNRLADLSYYLRQK